MKHTCPVFLYIVTVEQGEAYVPGVSVHRDGEVEYWFKYERPKVFQDKEGRAVQMNFAVIDTLKWEDLPGDRHSSKNICIPLNKGLLLSVLNEEPITAATKRIEVRIKAEPDFHPQTDVDVESLRFGSYNEVNFGRGCKPVKTRKEGDDLIIVFNGKGSGITADEFAPKLIGRDVKGNLLYGYARLPYVDYTPALLSARRPIYDKQQNVWKVQVENFGLSASQPTEVEIYSADQSLAKGEVPVLAPYEKTELTLRSVEALPTDSVACEVVIRSGEVELERVKFE